MKKIIFSLMAILLAVGLVGAGAFAQFFDVETSEGNVFTAGTIDIEVNEENPLESVLVELEDMKPCEYEEVFVRVTNVGTNPLNLWKHVGEIECDTGLLAYPVGAPVCSSEPEYEAEGGPDAWSPIDNICDWILVDMWIDVNDNGVFDDGIDMMILPIEIGVPLSGIECDWVPICYEEVYILPPLGPGETIVIVQSYHLHPDAGNEYQGDCCTFTITYYAEQLGGPGPSP